MEMVENTKQNWWQSFISRVAAIRTRMLIAFIAVTFLPIAGLIFINLISGSQSGQREATQRLDAILSYKADLFESWFFVIRSELQTISSGLENVENLGVLLSPLNEEESDFATEMTSTDDWIIDYHTLLNSLLLEASQFTEISLLDLNGNALISTNFDIEGTNYAEENFFKRGRHSSYIDTPRYNRKTQELEMFAAYPLVNSERGVYGVLLGKIDPIQLNRLLNKRTGLGDTGVTFIIDSNGTLLAGFDPALQGQQLQSDVVEHAIKSEGMDELSYANAGGISVVGLYRPIPEIEAFLIAELEESEATRESTASLAVNISVALASMQVAIIIALIVTRSISLPIQGMAETATQIAAGKRDLQVSTEYHDEIGVLGRAFNSMTSQLNALISGLEQRVAERTTELEERTSYLEASSQVSQVATSILDLNVLFREAVEVIRKRFNLYYVGLFLADDTNQWAVLQAGTGEAGQAMLKRHHKLPIGSASMIGWSIANNRARIAQIAEEDSVRLATPELPLTRSEAAIPLRSRGRVIGAISVQSEHSNAFNDTALAVLQSMADQLAIAIDNARFFEESRKAMEAERRAYGIKTASAWTTWLQARKDMSFRGSALGVTPTEEPWSPEMERAFKEGRSVVSRASESQLNTSTLAVPVNVRGNPIAVLQLKRSQADWSRDEVEALEKVADQLGLALDSARLYAETQQQAEQERLLSEITSRIRTSLDMDAVLQTAAREMRHTLNLAEVEIRLGMGNGKQPETQEVEEV